jgi:pimeloyl-ACP methyl ester carboxylesterase
MAHIKWAIRRHGYRPVIIPFSIKNKRDVLTYAKSITRYVREEAQRTGMKVDLIGTSMGGVTGLYALMFEGIADLVRTFVAVGAPFNGSPWANFFRPLSILGMVRTADQLSTRSRLLHKLRQTPLPEGPRYISLGGLYDTICPIPTHEIEGMRNIRHPFGHPDIMFRGWMHGYIAKNLLD